MNYRKKSIILQQIVTVVRGGSGGCISEFAVNVKNDQSLRKVFEIIRK